jgi:PHD/YefM family antitoxin component YafN of YafNO toxin-antitoxin module
MLRACRLPRKEVVGVLLSHDYGIGGFLMQMVPVKELKDTAKISRLCQESHEPVHVTKNGHPDMVIMSAETYEKLEQAAQVGRLVSLVQEGINAVERGECQDAFEAVASIRSKYGL